MNHHLPAKVALLINQLVWKEHLYVYYDVIIMDIMIIIGLVQFK